MSDWLRDRLHARHCEQCDVTRALLDERDALRAQVERVRALARKWSQQGNPARTELGAALDSQ